LAFRQVYVSHLERVIENYSLCTIYKSFVSLGFAKQIILHFLCQSQSYVTNDDQLANLSWCQGPIWGSRPNFYFCQTVSGLLIWSSLSDDRTGLSFRLNSTRNLGSYLTGNTLRLRYKSQPVNSV
jgi:hypothetical protein